MRSKVRATGKLRFSVSRSNKHIYIQLIDDRKGETVASASSLEIKSAKKGLKKKDIAGMVGSLVAEKAMEAGFDSAVLDRGFYAYHGRVQSAVEGARSKGFKI